MTTPDRERSAASPSVSVSRRTFLAGAAAAGGRRGGGIEGILAARRAPAFAQGTKLNIVRWVDFIPACDVELKRQAAEASKALGAEVMLRDHQRQRPPAPHHRRHPVGRGARHHPDAAQLAAPLRERDSSTSATSSSLAGKDAGRLYALSEANTKVGGK